MSDRNWAEVDRYLAELFVGPEAGLDAAQRVSEAEGLPSISVSAMHGRLLHLLARLQGAERILEIGTLGGYSAIWLARALPAQGRLVTLEVDPHHADVARRNVDAAGCGAVVDIRVGRAADVLERLVGERDAPFDMIFIDADKPAYPDYLRWALRLSRPGTLIVADNVVRDGKVLDASGEDANAAAVRAFLELCAAEPRLETTVVQTVGTKGWDGLALARVLR